ncbi:alanine racemase [Corynebacterium uropygiale]|uniref:Alanine racemase n=1 Tax=Corynebacterium uropygiale TaxID=1775911 RepID=A0A9X1TZQ1_9CORY|nr:alanine racemase [Corynebacterium uropygiale]MCF4005959.1 alanine racemase [Corynebacterium uropygiale]
MNNHCTLLRTRIDLDAIAHNTRLIAERLSPGTRLMAVVKADGYHHGALAVAATALNHGADALGVATIPEALELRGAGIDAPLLAWLWAAQDDDGVEGALAARVALGIPSVDHARAVIAAASRLQEESQDGSHPAARVFIKVETGMHRSGVDPERWAEVMDLLRDAPNVEVLGLFSHLSCADDPDHPANDAQAEQFARAIAYGRERGLALPINHLCNSPGTLTRPDLHHDMVRVGVALYGGEPIPAREHGLRPAMSWLATVALVKPVAPGEATSYGLTWTAERPGWLAVLPVGYADGLPRAAQGVLEVAIGGRRYPQVGRVCMDQILVDLGENPAGVAPGDEACIFGTEPGAMSASELAEALHTINYEVMCRPTGRTVRTFVAPEAAGLSAARHESEA